MKPFIVTEYREIEKEKDQETEKKKRVLVNPINLSCIRESDEGEAILYFRNNLVLKVMEKFDTVTNLMT